MKKVAQRSKKKASPFIPEHEIKYGLKVSSRSAADGAVTAVVCRFCVVFGREEKVCQKRKPTENAKYFELFRADNYQTHLNDQHQNKWLEYCDLTIDEDKRQFFASVATTFRNSLDSHLERNDCERYLIDKEIVCEIIGGLLFHSDDVSGVTQTKANSIFKSIEDDGDSSSDQSYVAVIRTGIVFQLCVKFISCGASFRMASILVQHVKYETGIA
jgi:hypothetical protein